MRQKSSDYMCASLPIFPGLSRLVKGLPLLALAVLLHACSGSSGPARAEARDYTGTGGNDTVVFDGNRELARISLGAGDDAVTIGPLVSVSEQIDGGAGDDTLIWLGGSIGVASQSALNSNAVRNFEHLTLTPGSDATLMLTPAAYAAMVDELRDNRLIVGEGVNIPEGLNMSSGDDTLEWRGGVIGIAQRSVKHNISTVEFRGLENLILRAPSQTLVSFRGTDGPIGGLIEEGAANRIEIARGIKITSSLDAGESVDAFVWLGGEVSEDDTTIFDPKLLSNFEDLFLTPENPSEEIRLTGEDIQGALERSGANTIAIGPGVRITTLLNPGTGIDTFIWRGGTVSSSPQDIRNNMLSVSLLADFENLHLLPAIGSHDFTGTTVISADGKDDLADGILDLDATNTLVVGERVRITTQINLGLGNDVLELRGGRIDSFLGGEGDDRVEVRGGEVDESLNGGPGADTLVYTHGTLNFDRISEFEHLTLVPTGNLSLSEEEIANMLDPSIGNRLTVGGKASLPALDLGAGNDTFDISGGTLRGSLNGGNGQNIFRISGGELQGDVDGGSNRDTFEISGGTVSGDVNGGSGNDFFQVTGGSIEGFIDGGSGNDELRIGGDVSLEDLRHRNIEVLPTAGGSNIAAADLAFEQLVLQHPEQGPVVFRMAEGYAFGAVGTRVVFAVGGESSSRLRVEGDIADGVEIALQRRYRRNVQDLSVADAVIATGRVGQVRTDNTHGLACTKNSCDLLLYDRAVPAALASASALEQLHLTDAYSSALLSEPAALGLRRTVRPLHLQRTRSGEINWGLSPDLSVQSRLSGVQSQLDYGGRNFSLHLNGQALHLDWSGAGGVGTLSGRLEGISTGAAMFWRPRGSSFFTGGSVRVESFGSDHLQLDEYPLDGRISSQGKSWRLTLGHGLFGDGRSRLAARLRWTRTDRRLQLTGLDRLQVRLDSDSAQQGRVGLIAEHSGARLQVQASLEHVVLDSPPAVRVVNVQGNDRIAWDAPRHLSQFRLELGAGLGQKSRVGLVAFRQSTWRQDDTDYRLQLSFNSSF